MPNNFFSMDKALLSISLAGHCQLVKMLTTLETHGILGSYLFLSFPQDDKGPVGTALANSAKFLEIRPRMYIEDLL